MRKTSALVVASVPVFLAFACVKKKGNYGLAPDSSAPQPTNQPTAAPPPASQPVVKAATAKKYDEPTQPKKPFDGDLRALDFPAKTEIAVRVFPHAAARGAGETPQAVTIVGACQLFPGASGRAARGGGKAVGKGQKFDLKFAKLKAPVWLDCSEPAQVIRGSDKINHRYEGTFYVHQAVNKKGQAIVEVINVVPVESYLRGVLPSEVIPSWPKESLKAQAVASRTYAYYNIAHNPVDYDPKIYDVDDTSFFQAYSGLTMANPMTDDAIKATSNMALSYGNKVILTFFNTDAGGLTESAKEVFNLDLPYCNAKREPHEPGPKSSWTKEFSVADASQKLAAAKVLPSGAPITGVEVASSDLSAGKRVKAMTFVLKGGTKKKVDAAAFKRVLDLKSALFTAKVVGDKLVFDGKGNGHGVGMSQVGAKELAAMGWDYKKILSFYYDDTKMCAVGKAEAGLAKCGPAKTAMNEAPAGSAGSQANL